MQRVMGFLSVSSLGGSILKLVHSLCRSSFREVYGSSVMTRSIVLIHVAGYLRLNGLKDNSKIGVMFSRLPVARPRSTSLITGEGLLRD